MIKGFTYSSKANYNQVKNLNGKNVSYDYDANGNIQTMTVDGKTIQYYYDELNELIREDNQVLNKTITYEYDTNGNIQSKNEYAYNTDSSGETLGTPTKTHSYGYDSTWKNKLTSYDGKEESLCLILVLIQETQVNFIVIITENTGKI